MNITLDGIVVFVKYIDECFYKELNKEFKKNL